MKKTNQVLSLLLAGFILIPSPAVTQNPPWKQFYDNGNDYLYNGKLDEAYAVLEGARNLNDQEPLIYWRMAQVLFLQEKRSLENIRVQRLQEELEKNPRSKKKLKDFNSFHFDIDDPVKFATYNAFLEITNEARRLAKERKNHDDPDIQEQSEFLLGALDGMEALYLGLIFDEKISAGSLTLTMLSRLQTL